MPSGVVFHGCDNIGLPLTEKVESAMFGGVPAPLGFNPSLLKLAKFFLFGVKHWLTRWRW